MGKEKSVPEINFKFMLIPLAMIVAACFMLFIVEPITMYSANSTDFWFDLRTMMPPLFLAFGVVLAISLIGFLIFYFVSKKAKRHGWFYISVLVCFDLFVIAYIHGNFLSGALPPLNGEPIDWGKFTLENIVSVALCLTIPAATIFAAKKWGTRKTSVVTGWASLAILIMVGVSLVSTLLTTNATKPKDMPTYATAKGINLYSSKKNFLILLVDATDSVLFTNAVKDDPLYLETFKDFTYFPDAVTAYRFTRDSIPFIMSGKWNYNEMNFDEYSTNAYDNSPLFAQLKDENYKMHFYDEDFVWASSKALEMENLVTHVKLVSKTKFLKQQMKYLLFKYLPFPLKKYSRIESLNFGNTQVEEEEPRFSWENLPNYENFRDNATEFTSDKVFQFVHLEGVHLPYDIDENFNHLEDAGYAKKSRAVLKLINAYVDRIRKSDVYNDSVIIVMADHGVGTAETDVNPILYVKGLDESHEMETSDKAIWWPDLMGMYKDLLAGKKSSELFPDITSTPRARYIIEDPWRADDVMPEWVLPEGVHAWEKEKVEKTGRVYEMEWKK